MFEPVTAGTAASVIQVGKRRWVVGMHWDTYEQEPDRARLLKSQITPDHTWTAVRIGEDTMQGGFCTPIAGVAKNAKLYSLAAMVADSREQPWLGIFEIEKDRLYWYVAVRHNNSILPDGDFVGTLDEIEAARDRHTGYGQWNFVKGDLTLLSEFLDEIKAPPTRVQIPGGNKGVFTKPIIAATALAVGAAVGGGWWYVQKQEQERLATNAAMAAMRAKLQANEQQAALVPTTVKAASPAEWLNACRSVLYPQPLSKFGWVLSEVACDANNATLIWKAGEGASVANMPGNVVTDEGMTNIEVIPLAAVNDADDADMIQIGDAKRAARAWSQQWGYALTLSDAPSQTLPGASQSQSVPAPPITNVVLAMKTSPFQQDFRALPGFRLKQIKATDSGWHVEGVIYGR
jgi:hypothetical protein